MPTEPTTSSRPPAYLPRKANDLILAGEWNEIQIQAREEIHSHDHSGGEKGVLIGSTGIQPGAINGTHLDPATKAAITDLTVTSTFKVGTRTLLSEVDGLVSRATSLESKVSALENNKVNRSGDTITGGLTVSNLLIAKEGVIAKCVSIGCETTEVPYEYEWETVGVSNAACHLRLQSPNSIIFHGTKGVFISKEYGGNGDLSVANNLQVDGLIKGRTTRPVREQLVHRRILFGLAGDQALDYGFRGAAVREETYHPFGYAIPELQKGARRRTRLYAIYSDNMQDKGSNEVRFDFFEPGTPSNFIDRQIFTFGTTWGAGSGSQANRDDYSKWVDRPLPSLLHARVLIRTTVEQNNVGVPTTGILRYLEIQSWDFFEIGLDLP